jgi:hypothetical protein
MNISIVLEHSVNATEHFLCVNPDNPVIILP